MRGGIEETEGGVELDRIEARDEVNDEAGDDDNAGG